MVRRLGRLHHPLQDVDAGRSGNDLSETRPPPQRHCRAWPGSPPGVSLVLAGLTNGLSQYLTAVLTDANDGETFSDQIRWGVDHPAVHQTEQALLLVSSLLLPIGILGLAQVSRWRAPRITAVATALALWGLWGFHTVIALGYAAGSIAPGVIGVDPAVALNDGFVGHSGSVAFALLPHLVGSFLGLLLLVLACWQGSVVSADSAGAAVGLPDLGLPAACVRRAGASSAAVRRVGLARACT